MIKNTKRGFNLIEIAIVLAVIGLVIGGIYVAASAVTENNRKQNAQKQLLNIVSNTRALYATQTTFVVPTAGVATQQIFPADMPATGAGTATNNYGGTTAITVAGAGQRFQVAVGGISQGACIDLLSKSFGSNQSVAQIGLASAAGTSGGDLTTGGTTGVTPAAAAGGCSAAGNANTATFIFNLRG